MKRRLTQRDLEILNRIMRFRRPNKNGQRINWKRFGRLVEFILFGAAIYSAYLGYTSSELSREALKDQRVSGAWQILAQTGGNGKSYALKALLKETDDPISGLTINCLHYVTEQTGEKCATTVDLSGLVLDGGNDGRQKIIGARFVGTNFTDSVFANLIFANSYFSQSDLTNVTFSNVTIQETQFIEGPPDTLRNTGVISQFTSTKPPAPKTIFSQVKLVKAKFKGNLTDYVFKNSTFRHLDFRNADLSAARFENITYALEMSSFGAIPHINISGAMLCREIQPDYFGPTGMEKWRCGKGIDQTFFNHAWFAADSRPQGIEQFSHFDIRVGCKISDNSEFSPNFPDSCIGDKSLLEIDSLPLSP